MAGARCFITGVDWDEVPPRAVRGSRVVYGEWTLYRSVAVLWPHLRDGGGRIQLPEAIPALVQDAYSDRPVGPVEWGEVLEEARRKSEDKQRDQRDKADVFRLCQVKGVGEPVLPGSIGA